MTNAQLSRRVAEILRLESAALSDDQMERMWRAISKRLDSRHAQFGTLEGPATPATIEDLTA